MHITHKIDYAIRLGCYTHTLSLSLLLTKGDHYPLNKDTPPIEASCDGTSGSSAGTIVSFTIKLPFPLLPLFLHSCPPSLTKTIYPSLKNKLKG